MGLVVDIGTQTAKNVAMGIRPLRSARLRRPRASVAFTGSDELIERYALQALRALLEHNGTVKGRSIVEFGPGDNLVSGLALLAAGAESYTTLDRFVPDYSAHDAKRWYAGLAEVWPKYFPDHPWPGWLEPGTFPFGLGHRVGFIEGSVEEARVERRFDLVCSFQVGEHVDDVNRFATLTAGLIAPGGLAMHRVDFGPHECWTRYDDPLTFLHFPPALWSAMGSNRGTSNRVRHHEFLAAFAEAGLRVKCAERDCFAEGSARIERLPRRFRAMPTESLLTGSAVYLCSHR